MDKISGRPGPEGFKEDLSGESATAQRSLRNHLPATIPMPSAKTPIKQKIKIPPYNMALNKTTIIMTFSFRKIHRPLRSADRLLSIATASFVLCL